MAWSASKVFARTMFAGLGGTAFNLSSDSFKAALFNNSITPDNTVTTATLTQFNGSGSQWVTANEQTSSSQWPTGGEALGSVTWTQSSNIDTFTAANTASSSGATLSNVYGTLVYDTTQASDGICYNYFGGANSVTSGVFTIVIPGDAA